MASRRLTVVDEDAAATVPDRRTAGGGAAALFSAGIGVGPTGKRHSPFRAWRNWAALRGKKSGTTGSHAADRETHSRVRHVAVRISTQLHLIPNRRPGRAFLYQIPSPTPPTLPTLQRPQFLPAAAGEMEETEMAQPDEGKEAPDRETTSLPTTTTIMELPTIEINGQPSMNSTPAASPPVNNQDLQDPDNAPRVGMSFQSEEEAYQFYNSYAQTKGFSIRKCHLKYRADQSISARYFVCNKAGVKTSNPTRVAKKEQAISRTNCMARVQFSITPEGIWSAQKVMLDHNHQLVSPDKRHMLRSQRQLLDADRHMIKQMRTSGIKQAEIYDFCELWYGLLVPQC